MADVNRIAEAPIRIACAQMEPRVGSKEANLKKSLELIDRAASNSAKLVAVPELCNSCYVFETRAEAFELAEEIPNGNTCKLWNEENLFFEPGNLGFPVFATAIGRIGAMICYDGWFPEAYRLLALQGADLICIPTNWVPIPGQDPRREAMANSWY